MRDMVRIILMLFLLSSVAVSATSQPLNYRDIFGDDWKKAEAFEKENRSWMEHALKRSHISYTLAIAVIFPELVRYSALRDKMETTLLKALYINLGDNYANFSIGQFQMKPSFAEMVRDQSQTLPGRRSSVRFKNSSDYDDVKSFRKSIVQDMEDPRIQFSYLIAFFRICETKWGITRGDDVTNVRFLATAYNFGINKNRAEIERMIDKRFFNTKLFRTDNYSYADVSLFWYNQFQIAK
jgi:hypothetical protein